MTDDNYLSVPATILGFIAFVILVCYLTNRDALYGFCRCCRELTCYYLKCGCLHKCDAPSYDCDIYYADGECCIACPGCCTPVVRERPDNTNEISEECVAMANVSEESANSNINVSTSESGMTGFSVARGITDDAPPSYESAITDMIVAIYRDPICPPPNYEEIIAQV